MNAKQELLAIRKDTQTIADVARDIRDCIEDEAEDETNESAYDAAIRRTEEFLNRERYRNF